MAETEAYARLEPGALLPEQELQAFLMNRAADGAVVSFVGLVRPHGKACTPIYGLHLDHHPTMTELSLKQIAADAGRRFEISGTWVVHRCGFVAAGEPVVFAAAAGAHRRAAFEAADYLMDRLKTEAVLWKREEGAEGSLWIEPTEEDRRDRQRWE